MPLPLRTALLLGLLAAHPVPLLGQGGEQELRGPSIVAGRIVDHESGRPVAGATVSLAAGRPGVTGAGTRTTTEEGLFRFDDVPPEAYLLVVTSLGYHRFEDSLQVQPGREIRLVVHLSASPLELEPLMVVTARRPAFMDGFEERRAHARGRIHTAFFTREEIQEVSPRDITELLYPVPGTYVTPGTFGDRLMVDGDVTRGGYCRPDVWVNGYLTVGGPSYNDVYPPEDIAAVELYAIEHDVPQRFKGPSRCGALVIWLRERGPEEQSPAAWKRWLAALGVLGAAILLGR